MSERRHNPWIWIPSLYTAEEIPAAVVTFVAVLMFLQFGASVEMASIYSGLLFLPWVMKSYLRSKIRKQGNFKRHIHIVEALSFVCLMGIAIYLSECRVKVWVLFIFMFVLSQLCACHALLSQMYYNRMLYPRQQRIFNQTKMFASQATLVLTYGVLIIVAGVFEVFFRSYQKAWAMESCLVAGVFLAYCALNYVVLLNPRVHNPYRYESLIGAFKNEVHVIERMRQKEHFTKVMVSAFFLFLPQALMFNSRVFFLLASAEDGGLGCSVQEVGFAQGTIGVIAFSVGVAIGRLLLDKRGADKMFVPFVLSLTLSPMFYMLMSQNPLVDNIMALCSMTFLAQLLFGFGINVCMLFVRYISEHRYANTIDYLYIPLVASVIFVPMMASGWLVTTLGFQLFFIVNVACAPLAWIILACLKTKSILVSNK